MKRVGGLFDRIADFENLWRAERLARRGKRFRAYALRFGSELEGNLLRLRDELLSGAYRPGTYRTFVVHEPKRRFISAAPYRDRVVQHALCRAIGPILDRAMVADSYACREGKGNHAAVRRAQHFLRGHDWVLKWDVRKYFATIDHEILKAKLRRKIKDPRVLELIDSIVDTGNPQEPVLDYFAGDDLFTPVVRRKGLPIGNLFSQWAANWYLNDVDRMVAQELRVPAVRYMDDGIVCGGSRRQMTQVRDRIRERLEADRLKLHPDKTVIFPSRQGACFLGFHVYRTHIRLLCETKRRQKRRLRVLQRGYRRGRLDLSQVSRSIRATIAHDRWADTYRLRSSMLRKVVF